MGVRVWDIKLWFVNDNGKPESVVLQQVQPNGQALGTPAGLAPTHTYMRPSRLLCGAVPSPSLSLTCLM